MSVAAIIDTSTHRKSYQTRYSLQLVLSVPILGCWGLGIPLGIPLRGIAIIYTMFLL